jgi:hypothetical protein
MGSTRISIVLRWYLASYGQRKTHDKVRIQEGTFK